LGKGEIDMADAPRRAVQVGDPAADGVPADRPNIDWVAIERSPEFRELVAKKRAFVVPATVFFLSWYFGFIILAGYAPDFMGSEFLVDGLTVGYVLALSQFLMTFVLGWLYVRRADRVFDPLSERAVKRALERSPGATEEAPATRPPPAPTGEVAPQ
jgi:uncharacterized membrane protein (DUF485 family)